MRIPAMLAVCSILSATTAHSQDLQFRTVTTSEALGMPLPGFTMNVAMKGQLTRIDIDVAGMWFSSIVDDAEKKMLMLNHEEMTYTERNGLRYAAHAGSRPQFRETGETQQIAGRKARRIVLTSNLSSTDDSIRMVMLQEMWVVRDAKLGAAFRRYINAMAASGKANAAGQIFGDIPDGAFPLRITMVVLAARPGERVDAEAVLTGAVPADKIQMRMIMEAADIRTTEVEPALFVVPNGYVKASK